MEKLTVNKMMIVIKKKREQTFIEKERGKGEKRAKLFVRINVLFLIVIKVILQMGL